MLCFFLYVCVAGSLLVRSFVRPFPTWKKNIVACFLIKLERPSFISMVRIADDGRLRRVRELELADLGECCSRCAPVSHVQLCAVWCACFIVCSVCNLIKHVL